VAVAVAVVVAVAVGLLWSARSDEDRARVVGGSASAGGWLRVEYRDVQVEIPPDWERWPDGDCLHDLDHWGPPPAAACGRSPGVSFFVDSGTFDAAWEPGVVRPALGEEGRTWSGYVSLGDVVVSVDDEDRAVVRRVLRSATPQGFWPIE